MGTKASQITSLAIVYSTVYSDADQRKYESPASLAFVRGIHRWPVNSPHKGLLTRKIFPFDDVIMMWHMLLVQDNIRCPGPNMIWMFPKYENCICDYDIKGLKFDTIKKTYINKKRHSKLHSDNISAPEFFVEFGATLNISLINTSYNRLWNWTWNSNW